MPAEGVELSPDANILTTEQIQRVARIFKSTGVKKVRLTGGEPLVHKDII